MAVLMSEDVTAKDVKKGAGVFVLFGVLTVILGFLAMGAPMMTGLVVTITIGVIMIVSGVGQIFHGSKVFEGGSRAVAILVGILAIIAGGVILARPMFGLATLTLMIAGYFIADGILQVVAGFQSKPQKGWGWLVFSGLVSAVLGIMIWRQWPVSGVWAVGILVGIRIFMAGFSMIFLGSATRQVASGFAAAKED